MKRQRTTITETQKRRLLLKWEAGLQDMKDHSKIRQAAEEIEVAENVVKASILFFKASILYQHDSCQGVISFHNKLKVLCILVHFVHSQL